MTTLLLAASAWADQCAGVDPETATAARGFLRPGSTWAALCEPCGESEPVAATVGEVRIVPTAAPPRVRVAIDGREVDLAYVFVEATPGARRLTNLAKLVRCPTRGVSGAIPNPRVPPAPERPVPSPCAVRTDADGDGRWDAVVRYGYRPDHVLDLVATDADADGRFDAVVRLSLDEAGHPLLAAHDDDGDGAVDRIADCREAACAANWAPRCPDGARCQGTELGLVTTVLQGASRVEHDYGCWTQEPAGWVYRRPADLPPAP